MRVIAGEWHGLESAACVRFCTGWTVRLQRARLYRPTVQSAAFALGSLASSSTALAIMTAAASASAWLGSMVHVASRAVCILPSLTRCTAVVHGVVPLVAARCGVPLAAVVECAVWHVVPGLSCVCTWR